MKDISLYIHIPFCEKKCYYCDFLSFSNKNEKIEPYINSLLIELSLYKEKLNDYNIKTIFIGGGTPSSVDSIYIKKILEYIYKNFNTENIEEITIEVNPENLDKEKMDNYIKAGINRVSLGAQTFNNKLLEKIGRNHKVHDIFESYKIIRKSGIKNINIELLIALPNQSLEDFMDSLKKAIDLRAEHISLNSLLLEENTYLNNLYNQGKLQLPGEDEERKMYHTSRKYLKEKGYIHYELLSYGLPGYESKHNNVYWSVLPYIGIGLASHSNFESNRFWNTSNINEYIKLLNSKKLPIEAKESISREMEISEYCILAFRKISGINKDEFKNRFNIKIEEIYGKIIKKHEANGLIINKEKNIELTSKGLDLSNQVEVDFLL